MAHAHSAPAPTKAPPPAGGHSNSFLGTQRTDNWWLGPGLTLLGLGGFGIYMTIVAFQASYYVAGPYLSPFYSPLIFVQPGVEHGAAHGLLGDHFPGWWPSWLPASPAFWIIPLPTMFRGTCYYYRKAYYRSLFGWPPACAVGPMQYGQYRGETGLLIFQNLHRYAFYIALVLLPILFFEAFSSLHWEGHGWGIGLGSVLLFVNASLLTFYTLGCHSLRHLVGGRLDCFSCDSQSQVSGRAWLGASWFNARHMQFAWMSLLWFWGTDLYIRGISMGFLPDINTWQGISWSSVVGGSF